MAASVDPARLPPINGQEGIYGKDASRSAALSGTSIDGGSTYTPALSSSSFFSIPRDSQLTQVSARSTETRSTRSIRSRQSARSSIDFGDSADTFYPEAQAQRTQARSIHTRLNQYVHLALWAIIGCWMRIRLENLSEEAGLASSDSAIFTNLIGNMIGCFTIGFLSTGGAFGDVIDRNLAIAPSSWRCIQENKELQLGLRTGFCGSLTTFASWNHAMLLLFLTDSKQGTANALFGYLIGILLCLISVFIGEYLALVVVIYFTPPADSRYRLLNGEKNEPLLFGIREDSSEQFNNLENQGSSSGDKFTSSFDYSLTERKSEGGNDESTKNEDGVDLGQSTSSLVTVKCLHIFVHFSLLACFTIVLFLFVTLPRASSTVKAAWWSLDRTQYLSLLVAPLGAFARYELSNNLNAWRSDFFVGTFAANLIACILDSIVYGIRDSKNGGNGSDMTMIYSAIGSGIGGCCSTVSTFMTDTIKLIPEHKYELPRSATRYVSVTIVTCCCSSLLIYKITKINYE